LILKASERLEASITQAVVYSYTKDLKEKGNYKWVLTSCIQALEKITEQAINAPVFSTIERQRPPGTGTSITIREETTWSDGSDESHTEIRDLPVQEEEALAQQAERGGPPLAMDSIGRTWPLTTGHGLIEGNGCPPHHP
jgi:hypothetical protein